MAIPTTFLDELRARVPVSAVAGRRVRLRRAGREWKGLSPFNAERTPSFFVNDHKMFWHDFSSGRHGDVFRFVMEVEGLDFRQAVEAIAALAGIELPRGHVPAAPAATPAPIVAPNTREIDHEAELLDRRRKARQLWTRSRPAAGTIVERYLRVRGYHGIIPATVRYLPANGAHAPALIAAYGMATEGEVHDHDRRWQAERVRPLPMPSPGDPKAVPWRGGAWLPDAAPLRISDEAVLGVHLVKLAADGSGKVGDPAKITIGIGIVAPIVLAPPGDLLGLCIAEGIEDALSAHQATGLGAWAAGGAGRLPGLADLVPSYVESITLLIDDDTAGRTYTDELAARAHARGIEVLMTPTEAYR